MATGEFELRSALGTGLYNNSNIYTYDGGRIDTSAIDHWLAQIHFYCPWALVAVYVVSFVAYWIITDKSAKLSIKGPGGRPLPPSAQKLREDAEKRALEEFSPSRKLVFIYLSVGTLATFCGNAIVILLQVVSEEVWCGEETAIYILASLFIYVVFLISLVDTSPAPSIVHQITWISALLVETVLLGATIALYAAADQGVENTASNKTSRWAIFGLVFDTFRVVLLSFAVTFYLLFAHERSYQQQSRSNLDENAPLLVNGLANENGIVNGNANGNGYEAANHSTDSGSAENRPTTNGSIAKLQAEVKPPAYHKPMVTKSSWEYLTGYSVFFPYLWPSKSRRLQVVVVVCFFLVVLQRIVNILVPMQIGRITDRLSGEDGQGASMPWFLISVLVALMFLSGAGGLIGAARAILWMPISQYTYQALTTASFEHVHNLSLDFHLGKRTGEVTQALAKGNSINTFLEQVTFEVLPMIFDLTVAIAYFAIAFDAYYALAVGIVTFAYLYLTIRMARWRSNQRRAVQNLQREEAAIKNDSIASYETVKYFNAEGHEFNRYRQAVIAYQEMEWAVLLQLNVLNISQNFVFTAGVLATSFLAAYQVTKGIRKVGDFVLLISYMSQLQQPLNFFGTFYRGMQSAMISGERLLEIFKEQTTVEDEPTAVSMPVCEGGIHFDDVKFSYDARKPALEHLSFTCRPGTTTALVGESGGGKSTVLRLLFRFYNPLHGSIKLDGNDVRDITIDSLRSHIGVVPQDTVLFNETIMYNLRYANQDASDEEIYDACRAACIHDKIMDCPDGYETKVGERGLGLSGGERQRVAIARTILKNPRIILLDEATAALDSDTEQHIQEALKRVSKGRTMLVIAHRLSTITSADQILVLHGGRVAESGTHHELLLKSGRYANMWKKQTRIERAAEQAHKAVERAAMLRIAAERVSASSGTDGGPGATGRSSSDTSEDEGEGRLNKGLAAPAVAARALARSAASFGDGDISNVTSADESSDDHKSYNGNADKPSTSVADKPTLSA